MLIQHIGLEPIESEGSCLSKPSASEDIKPKHKRTQSLQQHKEGNYDALLNNKSDSSNKVAGQWIVKAAKGRDTSLFSQIYDKLEKESCEPEPPKISMEAVRREEPVELNKKKRRKRKTRSLKKNMKTSPIRDLQSPQMKPEQQIVKPLLSGVEHVVGPSPERPSQPILIESINKELLNSSSSSDRSSPGTPLSFVKNCFRNIFLMNAYRRTFKQNNMLR